MPHVVLSGRFLLSEWRQDFSALREQTQDWIIKVDELYVEHGGVRAILPAAVIEEGHPQNFYIRVASADLQQRHTIRLDPLTDPIKTKGVKRSIAVIAEALMDRIPNFVIETHNLADFILRDDKSPLASVEA